MVTPTIALRAPSEPAVDSTGQDKPVGVRILSTEMMGLVTVKDLFWLDERRLLVTGYEGESSCGWVVDVQEYKTVMIPMPSKDATMIVPLGLDSLPSRRYDEQGDPEVLLGFITAEGGIKASCAWSWYTNGGALLDAAVTEDLPTKEWREVVVSAAGIVEAILVTNGTVYRRTLKEWRSVGTLQLAASEGTTWLDKPGTTLPLKHLVGAGPDFSVYALDILGPRSPMPQRFPSREQLSGSEDTPSEVRPEWVLEQCQQRQVAALVQMVSEESLPLPVFAHPFADVLPMGIWLDPVTNELDVVTVEDLRPQVHALSPGSIELLASLRVLVPHEINFGGFTLQGTDLEPLFVKRFRGRWVVYYFHPTLQGQVALPAAVEGGKATWIGSEALPAVGATLSPKALEVRPELEGHRIRAGSHDVPLYLISPEGGRSAALVVRVHDGPLLRDSWGADDIDAWLLSRNYAVLKVNFRGSAGFGRWWSSVAPTGADMQGGRLDEDGGGFLDDIVAGVRWALTERRVLGSPAGVGPAPVAVMGSYFGGYAVLQAMLHHRDVFAGGIAIGPVQKLDHWPDTYVPNSVVRGEVGAARCAAEASDVSSLGPDDSRKDAAHGVLSPAAWGQKLATAPLLVVEFELDSEESRGSLLPSLMSSGDNPGALHFVQYAGERRGGGTISQNGLDQYRRIDAFLSDVLRASERSEEAGATEILSEPFVEEVPFLSASLFPGRRGRSSQISKSLEAAFTSALRNLNPEIAAKLPMCGEQGMKKQGFKSSEPMKTTKKRGSAPGIRLKVRSDGTIELTLAFEAEPEGLHLLVSEVWFHLRAEGLSFTLALPREPIGTSQILCSRTGTVGEYVFEIPANPSKGAIENYNAWARLGQEVKLVSMMGPDQIAASPVLISDGDVTVIT